MERWMTFVLALAVCLASGCGGKKLKDSGFSGEEILFINETPENIYRITIVGTTSEFTLRPTTQKAVRMPVDADDEDLPSFNINLERTEGDAGQERISVSAKPGTTVRIFVEKTSFQVRDVVKVEVES